jgi:putative hydrolase of the HAD superfamily
MTFDTYIFDLYGTLIDIHTDESIPGLWQDMAAYLEWQFGASYTAKELRQRYIDICAREEKELKLWLEKERGITTKHPEIRITWVWTRLIAEKLKQAGNTRAQEMRRATSPDTGEILQLMDSYTPHKYDETEFITPQIQALCNYFRETSRDKLMKYEGVDETFAELKSSGKKIFLLSNAQRAFTEKELSECGLSDAFDGIFISSDRMIKKPDPRFMDELVIKYELDKSKCVMIGNEISCDVGVAASSGVKSIFLNTYSVPEKKMTSDINKLDITDCDLYPAIIADGHIEKILGI